MAPITTWIVVALGTAVVVMVVAGTTRGVRRHGFRQFFGDLWAGIRRAPGADGVVPPADTREELPGSSEAGGVAELFSVGETPENAYVEAVEITAPLARATRRTLRGVLRRARS